MIAPAETPQTLAERGVPWRRGRRPEGRAAVAWHTLTVEEALDRLDSAPGGLRPAEAAARLQAIGPNRLPTARAPAIPLVFLRQFASPLIYVLLAAAAVSAFLSRWEDAGFILFVLLLNAVIGTIQEWRAETSAAALRNTLHRTATVLRAGERRAIDAAEVAPGDIVILESGASVPADLRLISADGLRLDESLLTGESAEVTKVDEALADAGAPLGDRRNMAFQGSLVLRGRGAGVVCATGSATALGRIAEALGRAEIAPPLLVRLKGFSNRLAIAMLGVIAVIAAIQLLRGHGWADTLLLAIALAVAAIPEGLPVAITAALAIAASRMARRNVIVRRLPAVEGLGSCTLVASDKTGTLTVNRLTVKRLMTAAGDGFEVGGEGLDVEGDVTPAPTPAALRLARAGVRANEGELHVDGAGVEADGDMVDVGFLVLGRKLDPGPAVPAGARRLDLIPYESERAFSAALWQEADGRRLYAKGAPETLLRMCQGYDRAAVEAAVHALAADGYRVIALAEREAPGVDRLDPDRLEGMTFLGLAGLIDPLRPEAAQAVARCREAGVAVRMVTGDHPETALAIARRLGIAAEDSRAVTGRELADLEPAERAARIRTAAVFARVEPAQKTLIVESLQADGEFVAVTGDGVNDAPALKAAQIGVAMGASGTDVARAASDLIVSDDNFASIVDGVEEGRRAYDNIRKVVWLVVSTAIAEIVLFAFAVATGLPMPLTPVQVLWLNLVTQGVQDVALAFERGEPDAMRRGPRPPREPIFDRRMIEQSLITGLYVGVVAFGLFAGFSLYDGIGEDQARNLTLAFLVLFENAHCFNCRSETRSVFRIPLRDNPWIVGGVTLALGLHLTAMHVPALQQILDVGPVTLEEGLVLVAVALSVLAVGEGYKLARGRRRAPAHAQ